MKRKITSFVSVFTIVFTFILGTTHIKANEEVDWEIKYDEEEVIYLQNTKDDSKILSAFGYDENENLVEIDLAEYQVTLNTTERVDSVDFIDTSVKSLELREVPTYYYMSRFVKSGQTIVTGLSYKVSADVKGLGTVTASSDISVNNAFSISVGASSDITKLIKGSISGAWNISATTGANSGVSYSVANGTIGYIKFAPYYTKVYGTSYYDKYSPNEYFISSTSGASYGLSPKKLSNGILDGIYTYHTK